MYRLTISSGRAGRLKGRVYTGCDCTPRFGFNWWFWLPSASSNGGRFSRGEVVDVNFHWLCFWCSVTFWPCGGQRA